jgi:hypothetical protein
MILTSYRLQEHLEIELDGTDGVRQLELVQNAGVQDAEDADGVVLAAEVDLDRRRVAGEEGLVCNEELAIVMDVFKTSCACGLPSTSSIQYPSNAAFFSPSSLVMNLLLSISIRRSSRP